MRYLALLLLVLASCVLAAEEQSKAKREVSPIHIDTKECGTRKNCFVSPADCDSKNDLCEYVLKWDYDGYYINYDLKAVTKNWISVLFSDDTKLGNDNVVMCEYRTDTTSNIDIKHYFLRHINSETDLEALSPNNDGLSNKAGYYKDGLIHCKFSRTKTSSNPHVNNLNKGHYIFVSRGAPGDLVIASLQNAFPTDKPGEVKTQPIEFHTVTRYTEPSSWLVKFHAIIMLIAWIFLSSLGILMARYYKPMWVNHILLKTRVWFSFHRSLMLTVLVLTLLSFLLILIHMGFTWSKDGMEFVHSILGIIVICLVVINPILGFCRPKPDTKLRCLFFWFHWLIGTVAYCLSVPAIFIGMDLRKIDVPNWCSWLLFFWVIFHIIVEIILEVHYCCTFHKHNEKYYEYAVTADKSVVVIDKRRNPPGYRWKPTLLFIYAAVTAIVVSIIVIAILIKDFI